MKHWKLEILVLKKLTPFEKARHFKCHVCHKKLFTGPGLAIHMMQVHKETIDAIPNALSSRCDPEIEIYGMKGIPVEDMMRHQREAHAKTVSPFYNFGSTETFNTVEFHK